MTVTAPSSALFQTFEAMQTTQNTLKIKAKKYPPQFFFNCEELFLIRSFFLCMGTVRNKKRNVSVVSAGALFRIYYVSRMSFFYLQ